jgi:hypothetical protein
MYKCFLPVRVMLLACFLFLCACKNEQNEKQATQIPKDTDKTPGGGASKPDSSTAGGIRRPDSPASNKNNQAATADNKIKKPIIKQKENMSNGQDSASSLKDKSVPVTKTDNADNKTSPPASTAPTNTSNLPFVSKYGTIPRNATIGDMAEFFKAFPDKTTLIKVNFDGPSDDEMNGVKALIIKLLRNSGYSNVQDQSAIIEPQRMPKEIHYELQRNGSVIFWVPVANTEQ